MASRASVRARVFALAGAAALVAALGSAAGAGATNVSDFTVTPATGGSNISASTAGGTWTSLGGPVINVAPYSNPDTIPTGTTFTPSNGVWALNYTGVVHLDGSSQYSMAGYGIGGNIEYSPFPPTIQGVNWSIVTGVASGGTPSSTTVICSGTDTAPTLTDTGRLFFGLYEEFNTAAAASGCPTLKATKSGTIYWQTNQVNTGGGLFQLAYESNTDVPPINGFGPPQPQDDSFFYSPAFGFSTFTNTNQLGPFHTFSTDIEGSLVKK